MHRTQAPFIIAHSRTNPFAAPLLENRLLSGDASGKEVRHIVFDLAGSGLEYRVGQSLGVYSHNAEGDVSAILKAAGFTGDEPVMLPKATAAMPIRAALTTELFLAAPTKKSIEAFAAAATSPKEKSALENLLAPECVDELKIFTEERFFIDLLEEFPSARLSPQAFVDLMRKLQPRLYSIASSPKVVGTRVELTVGIVRFSTNGRKRNGVCSTYMSDRIAIGEKAGVFIGESPFKLTDDDTAPIIMVGPGTGIAPFRAFLQERSARKATGSNWLFFGDQHRAADYLYESEFEAYKKSGFLTKLSLAWSRDQAKKVYVQDLMRESSAELFDWIFNKKGCFYVCGDAKRMAKDVEAALLDILKAGASMDDTAAAAYLSEMKKAGRYLRDVY